MIDIKNYLGKLLKAAIDSNYRFRVLDSRGFYNYMSDEEYLKKMFRIKMGYPLDLENPKTFNEKLQWLKIHDRKPEYTTMVDKYAVKKYVADKIGEEYIIPTLGVWDKFDDIDFDKLPEQFVLKCTHDSGGLVICRDKSQFDINAAKKKINKCLNINYYWSGREWPYKNVPPRIIAEKFMQEISGEDLIDYKLYCFNGIPKLAYVSQSMSDHTKARISYVSLDWRQLPFHRTDYASFEVLPPKPNNFSKILDFSKILSSGTKYLRTDFYEIEENIFFSELTFFPGGGYTVLTPDEWDYKLGEYIDLEE